MEACSERQIDIQKKQQKVTICLSEMCNECNIRVYFVTAEMQAARSIRAAVWVICYALFIHV